MLGLDVHDMEALGEDNVGYDAETIRSDQFGLAVLRLGRRLEADFVVTVEPGIYFIPALMDQWRQEGRWSDFIAFDKLAGYREKYHELAAKVREIASEEVNFWK